MRIDVISDHALLRWMERAHGVDIEMWRNLMRDEVNAALSAGRRRRTMVGPCFVMSPDAAKVVTYLGDDTPVSPFGNGVAIPRHPEADPAASLV